MVLYNFKLTSNMYSSHGCYLPMDVSHTVPSCSSFSTAGHHSLQQMGSILHLLLKREDQRMQEVQDLKFQLATLKATMQETIANTIRQEMTKYMEKVQSSYPQMKQLVKDRKCTVDGCNRVYSSQTALRAHIRSKHCCQEQSSEEFKPLF